MYAKRASTIINSCCWMWMWMCIWKRGEKQRMNEIDAIICVWSHQSIIVAGNGNSHRYTLLFKIKWHLVEQQQQQQRKLCIDTTRTAHTHNYRRSNDVNNPFGIRLSIALQSFLLCHRDLRFAHKTKNAKETKERGNALCVITVEHISTETGFRTHI